MGVPFVVLAKVALIAGAGRGAALVVALTVDSGPVDAGCGCSDRWGCPLWCWRRRL